MAVKVTAARFTTSQLTKMFDNTTSFWTTAINQGRLKGAREGNSPSSPWSVSPTALLSFINGCRNGDGQYIAEDLRSPFLTVDSVLKRLGVAVNGSTRTKMYKMLTSKKMRGINFSKSWRIREADAPWETLKEKFAVEIAAAKALEALAPETPETEEEANPIDEETRELAKQLITVLEQKEVKVTTGLALEFLGLSHHLLKTYNSSYNDGGNPIKDVKAVLVEWLNDLRIT